VHSSFERFAIAVVEHTERNCISVSHHMSP
jgi:hypothetical protein